MKLRFWKQQKARGKSKSADTKLKEKQSKVDSFLLDSWLKQLKDNPELAQEMAMQKFGLTGPVVSGDSDGDYRPDLLDVLRQAKQARELVKDELGDSKGSMLKDVLKALPAIPGILAELRQMQGAPQQIPQQMPQIEQRPRQQLKQPEPEPTPEPEQQPKLEAKLASLLDLLELSPEEAYQQLQNRGETGWIAYLQTHSHEELLNILQKLTEDPEHGQFVAKFLQEKGKWLEELVYHAQQTAN